MFGRPLENISEMFGILLGDVWETFRGRFGDIHSLPFVARIGARLDLLLAKN